MIDQFFSYHIAFPYPHENRFCFAKKNPKEGWTHPSQPMQFMEDLQLFTESNNDYSAQHFSYSLPHSWNAEKNHLLYTQLNFPTIFCTPHYPIYSY